jgi:hypothetical protein
LSVDKRVKSERNRKWAAANREKSRGDSRKRRSGFSAELYAAALTLQNNACAICRRPFNEKIKPHADHDHGARMPRGVLCHNCNVAEGHIKRTGMSPAAFAACLADYVANSPVRQVLTEKQYVVKMQLMDR